MQSISFMGEPYDYILEKNLKCIIHSFNQFLHRKNYKY